MQVSTKCIAVRKVATPLRELTCHMGSHSVTCHPAEVTLLLCFSLGYRHSSYPGLSLFPLLSSTLPGPSASEVTTSWRYTNAFIIIIITIINIISSLRRHSVAIRPLLAARAWASPRRGLGWTCPPHFCYRSLLKLIHIRRVFTGGTG